MVVVAMTKKTLELAEDKQMRTLLASIVAGIVIVMLTPLLVIVFILNTQAGFSQGVVRIIFDRGLIPMDIDAKLSKTMEEVTDTSEELNQMIGSLEEDRFGDIKVKSFFYTLYFTEDLTDFDEEFYMGFVDCFVGEGEEDEIYEELKDYPSYEFAETEKVEIRNLYLFIKYGYFTIDKVTGIPGEALSDATFAQLMQEATKYIGFPHQWGGSTPGINFNCSGSVCWVYTHSGVRNLLGATVQQIYSQHTPMSKDKVKPGDLMFFTGAYQSSNPVTHIGIHVGDSQMLHCGGPIGYANSRNSCWVKYFYGFGRLQRSTKSMMKEITVGELKKMTDEEGLILQDCDGDLKEWGDGVNELLIESGILLGGDTFKNVYVFENEESTNLLLNMDDVKLDVGKPAIWRINTRQQSDDIWLSDYFANKFEIGEELKSSMESEL